MNEEVKNKKLELTELKFRNKEEIAKSRQDLVQNLKEIKDKIIQAHKQEKQLKINIQKEIIQIKSETKKAELLFQKDLQENHNLIIQNRKQLLEETKALQKQIQIQKLNEKKAKMEFQKNSKLTILELKKDIKNQQRLLREKVNAAKLETKMAYLELKKQMESSKEEMAKFKLEWDKLLLEKKTQLLNDKKEFMSKKTDSKLKIRSMRDSRLSAAKVNNQELKAKKAEIKNKYQEKVLTLKSNILSKQKELLDQRQDVNTKLEQSKLEFNELREALSTEIVSVVSGIKEDKIANKQELKKEFVSTIPSAPVVVEDISKPQNITNNDSDKHIRGELMSDVGKKALVIFDKLNKKDTKLTIDKVRLSNDLIEGVKDLRQLKANESLIDITEFVKYINFIVDQEVNIKDVSQKIVSIVINLLRGKTFSFLNGYFSHRIINNFNVITFSKTLLVPEYSLFSLDDTPFVNKFSEELIEVLSKGGVIAVTNNLALRYKKDTTDEIEVMHDLPFLR